MSITITIAPTIAHANSDADEKAGPIGSHNERHANQLLPLDRELGPVEHVDINFLKTYSNNPRKHPEKQIVKLMASISEFGIALPILVDVEHVIIAGAAVVEAARRLGFLKLPIIVADQWSNSQVRAYRLASNRLAELSSWDEDLLAIELSAIIECAELPIEALGWETAEIDVIIEGAEREPEADPADQIPESSGTVTGLRRRH